MLARMSVSFMAAVATRENDTGSARSCDASAHFGTNIAPLGAMSAKLLPQSTCTPSAPRVIERRTGLTHHEFEERYRHKRPVILAGLASDWTALSRWMDAAHLCTLLEDEVLVLRSRDGRQFLKRDCEQFDGPFPRVAEMLFQPATGRRPGQRLYARAPLKDGLRDEVCLRSLEELVGGAVGAHAFQDAKCGVWLGSAGCITPLHYDLCHGFLAGVLGTKHFTYFSPEDFRSLYPRAAEPYTLEAGLRYATELSQHVDAWQHREWAEARQEARPAESPEACGEAAEQRIRAESSAWHATVLPGDVLYTPPYWWHHVVTSESEGAALSVLVPFDPTPEEPLHNCHLE